MKAHIQKIFAVIITISLLLPQFPLPAQAVESLLKITEIYSNADTGESEWIEIHWLGHETHNLGGVTIWDDVGKIHTIAEGTSIEPDQYLVVSGWTSKLNNTGDSVIIKDSDGELVAQVLDFPAIAKGKSWYPSAATTDTPTPAAPHAEYDTPVESPLASPSDEPGEPEPSPSPDESDEENGNNDPEIPQEEEDQATPTPTPDTGEGEQDEEPETPDESDETTAGPSPELTVFVSEIVSNPEGEEGEWVEIVTEETGSVDLSGFLLADEIGDFFVFPEGSVAKPNEYLVVTGWGNKLNNTGDSLFLKRADGSIVESVIEFPALEKGESWLPQEQQKGIPTRGAANRLLEPLPSQTPSLSPSPDPEPSPSPLPTPTPEVEASPTPIASAEPTASALPSLEPTPDPSDAPLPSPLVPLPQPAEIEISEIMSNPLESESEWVELYSQAEAEVSLGGCTLSDAVGVIFTFPDDTILAPQSYLVIDGWGNKLNNTGDSLSLRTPDGVEIAIAEGFPALDKDVTWLPMEAAEGIPTPGEPNQIRETETIPPPQEDEPEQSPPPEEAPEPTPPADMIENGEIIVSEVMTNPLDGLEWVELSSRSEEQVQLDGLELHDALGAILVLDETHSIEPNGYLVVSGWPDKLNNSGDTVTLQTGLGKVIDGPHQIPALTKGMSYSIDFAAATVPTPGEQNQPPEDNTGDDEAEEGVTDEPEEREENEVSATLAVIINEVFASPANGADEWVELYSQAEAEIDLSGFTMHDAQGLMTTITHGSVIAPNGYLVISGWNGKLNNSGDTVSLRTPNGSIVTTIDYPSLASEKSWGFDGTSYRRTDNATPGSANQFAAASSGGGGSSGASTGKKSIPVLLKQPAKHRSAKREEFELEISEVLFSGTSDFVELYCRRCDLDLAGIRVADDKAFFEFPEGTEVATGEYVVIHFADEAEDMRHENGVWHFWATKSGLTASDETIFVIDSWGNVADALCIANQNGKFSPGEEEDVVLLIKQGVLSANRPLTEMYCFDSGRIGKGKALVRGNNGSGFAQLDFFAHDTPSPGKPNPLPPRSAADVDLRINSAVPIGNEAFLLGITNQGGSAVKLAAFGIYNGDGLLLSLPDIHLYHRQTYFLTLPIAAAGSPVELRDHWGNTAATWHNDWNETSEGETGLKITEVLANPDGTDSGNEFVEVSCQHEKCERGGYILQIGDEALPVPLEDLRRHEREVYTEYTLRNSDLQLSLVDPQQLTHQIVSIPTASSGKSYVWSETGFEWSRLPTPGEKNIVMDENRWRDTDRDGIPDLVERDLELDPHSSDIANPIAERLYYAHLRDNSHIDVTTDRDGLKIRGKTLPFAKGKIVLHSKQHVFDISADAEGHFALDITPDIEPGEHRLDMLIEQEKNRFLALKELKTIAVETNPQAEWLKQIQIHRVLPNPDGADSKREYVILENPTDAAGWLKKATLSNGKKEIRIPDTYFGAGQKRVFAAKQIPTLANKNGMIRVIANNGDVLDELAWKSAKSGQLYWHDMPPIVPKAKKPKTRLQKGVRSRYPVPYGPHYTESERRLENLRFLGIEDNSILAETNTGEVIEYPLDEELSAEFLADALAVGDAISLVLIGNVIVAVEKHASVIIDPAELSPVYRQALLIVLLIALFASSGATFVYSQRSKTLVRQ